MGFLDEVQSSFNRGMAGANRGVASARLKVQLADVDRRRKEALAQLGANLYEVTKNEPAWHVGREALYDAVAALDAERAGYQQQMAGIEAEAVAAQTIECPFCHSAVSVSAAFCQGCGTSMSQIQTTLAARQTPGASGAIGSASCPSCGAPVTPGDTFCMCCGKKLTWGDEASEGSAGSAGSVGSEGGASAATSAENSPTEGANANDPAAKGAEQ